MKNNIKEAKKEQDSLGGVVEGCSFKPAAGIGSPFLRFVGKRHSPYNVFHSG